MKNIVEIIKGIKDRKGNILQTGGDGLAFTLPGGLRVIFSWGGDWEHASVSIKRKIPVWQQMCEVKSLLWKSDECCFQLHPKESDYINTHISVCIFGDL